MDVRTLEVFSIYFKLPIFVQEDFFSKSLKLKQKKMLSFK